MKDMDRVESFLLNALSEDIGSGDITSCAIVPEAHRSEAVIIAEENFILAGIHFAEKIFRLVNPELKFTASVKDGRSVKKGAVIARISGSTRGLLTGERTALNIVQRLSGIATLTRKFVTFVKGTSVKITDTRKTTPGFRFFEKYAVRAGGGTNHRFGLFDGILIKDNHIRAAGNIRNAVKLARENSQHMLKIEVEAGSMKEVRESLSSCVDVIMLDNMTLRDIRKAVEIIFGKSPRPLIEVSGGITLDNVRKIAELGVDLISIGALTHSSAAADISMDIKELSC